MHTLMSTFAAFDALFLFSSIAHHQLWA